MDKPNSSKLLETLADLENLKKISESDYQLLQRWLTRKLSNRRGDKFKNLSNEQLREELYLQFQFMLKKDPAMYGKHFRYHLETLRMAGAIRTFFS